jgi:DNA-binding CsgD family transcriptional regulator
VRPAARDDRDGEAILDGVLRSLGLSARERQVASMCSQGRPAEAIAAELFLSPWTVRDHLKAIYAKTGFGTRSELTAFAAGL